MPQGFFNALVFLASNPLRTERKKRRSDRSAASQPSPGGRSDICCSEFSDTDTAAMASSPQPSVKATGVAGSVEMIQLKCHMSL